MKLKKIMTIIMLGTVLMSSVPVSAAENELRISQEYPEEEDYESFVNIDYAKPVNADTPSECINSDGTFTLEISNVGYVKKSDKFKVSDSSCTVTIDAGAGSASGSEYYVTLKNSLGVTVKKVTYYTGGVYQYTFKNLNTSTKYYLEFDSNHTTLNCSGTISNYVGL